jgi:DNA polymerase family A/3'-5' exonuclease
MLRLGLDTETTVHEDQSVPDLVCVGYATDEAGGLLDRIDGQAFAESVIKDESIEIATHNGPFDFAVLAKQDPALFPAIFQAYEEGRIVDTMTFAMCDDIARGVYFGTRKGRYGLGDLSVSLLSEEMDKDADTYRLRYGELMHTPIAQWPEEARRYALHDPRQTLRVSRAIIEPADARRQVAHAWWLHLMSAHGVMTDQARVKPFLASVVRECVDLCSGIPGDPLPGLIPAGLVRLDPKDGELHQNLKAVRERIGAFLGDNAPRTDPSKTHPKGQIQTSAEACEAFGVDGTQDPLLIRYARLAQLLDVINKDSKYLENGIVRCRYGLAETGRSTCFAPNLQNLKREGGIRECFIPRPGYVFASADFSGLELCTLAEVCLQLLGYSRLGEDINRGIDPHCVVAARLLGCDYDEAVRRYKAKDPLAINARQTGKVANFGLPGGLGPKSLVTYAWSNYRVKITLQEAKQLKALWLKLYPEFVDYLRMINDMGEQVTQLYSGRVRGNTIYTERANTLFQGLGGDATKCAGFYLSKACYAQPGHILFGSRPVNYEHDAFLVEVPEEIGHECAIAMSEIMIEGAKLFIPNFKLKADPLLCRRWSKEADEVWVNDRLVPWDKAA